MHTYTHAHLPHSQQPFPSVLGHQFKLRRFSRPCTCDVCGEIIWQDGLMCNCKWQLCDRHTWQLCDRHMWQL